MIYILGIMTGLLISILLLLLINRFHVPIHRNIEKALNNPHITGNTGAYIAGLTEEEQAFMDSLNVDNKDTKLS